jgi:hypothetical protein
MQIENNKAHFYNPAAQGHIKSAKAPQAVVAESDIGNASDNGEIAQDQVILGEVKLRGVIRNLMNGHYKGVADVRLRINFHDELTSLEQGSVDQAIQSKNGYLEEMQAALQPFAELAESENSQWAELGGWAQDLSAQIEAFQAGGSKAEAQANFAVINDAFESFKASLEALLAEIQAEAEPVAEEAVDPAAEPPEGVQVAVLSEDPAQEAEEAPLPEATPEASASTHSPDTDAVESAGSGPDLEAMAQDFLAAWQDFQNVLGELGTELERASSLPKLSPEPHNNGGAYAKFLAIYQTMQGLSAPTEPREPPMEPVERLGEQPVTEPLDVVI